MLAPLFFVSILFVGGWWFFKELTIETIVLTEHTAISYGTVPSSVVPAKQESPIKSSFNVDNNSFVTLVLEPKEKDCTYVAEDVLTAFDGAELKYFISKVTLRNMDLKTFAVPVLNGIIERMHEIRSDIIKNGPTLLHPSKDYFLKKFKEDCEVRRKLKMEFLNDNLLALKKGFRPTTNDIKDKEILRSYCKKNCVFTSYYTRDKQSEVDAIQEKFISLVLKIAENYANIDAALKPKATDYFNTEMDKEGENFIKEYLEAADILFFDRYVYALSGCCMFSKFESLINACFKKQVQPIQEIHEYIMSQKHGNFSVVHDELKRMLTEFIDKVHTAGKTENTPDDIYLKTFDEFKMEFSNHFDFDVENCQWDPDSIKGISVNEFDENLRAALKHHTGHEDYLHFHLFYPRNELKESIELK